MKIFELYVVSSLEKCFLNSEPPKTQFKHASALRGERYSFQVLYKCTGEFSVLSKIRTSSTLKGNIMVRMVGNVPCELPCEKNNCDSDFLSTEPGLYPDPLYPITEEFYANPYALRSIWITVELDNDEKPDIHDIDIEFIDVNTNESQKTTFTIEVINAILPKSDIIYTQWFHSDCIASYYNFKVFSDEYWNMVEKFISLAVKTGINMILTPVFTPPLDTKIGGERLTVQLVSIKINDGKYSFDFSNFDRWVTMCQQNGIKYFEISHFFTQWGANFAPKIVATVDGKEKRIFGWDTKATSDEYVNFLKTFIPEFDKYIKKANLCDKVYFHVSDEPQSKDIRSYSAAKNIIEPLLPNYQFIDAMSEYEFYSLGLIKHPIPSNDKIQDFIDNKVENLWTYYCCCQAKKVSNRFIAMPSYRNRIIATQIYKYSIVGFLQWGYNFYYSKLSDHLINPFCVTDAEYAFPSGDPFSVYPGKDGPIESLRSVVFFEALQDISAMKLLEKYIGKESVISLVEGDACCSITFDDYPHHPDFILSFRDKINKKIKEYVNLLS